MTKQTKGILWYILVMGTLVFATAKAALPAGWPTNYQHFTNIRDTAKGLTKGTHICFTLNNGDMVFGEFLKYEAYTDYIWYQPQNTGHNWFKQDAFEVHELFRIDVVTQEPV